MIASSSYSAVLEEEFDVSGELKLYFENKFLSDKKIASSFADEPYLKSWKSYCSEAEKVGVFQVLKACYPQLNFPIEEGINKTQDYIDVVLKGKTELINGQNYLQLNNSEGLEISIYESIAGNVPVLKIADNQDFIKIVQCLLHKNNPAAVPQSMGASLLNGINNWDRIHSLKKTWLANNPLGNWNQEFSSNILPNSDLYKDKIIMLSTKPYSNVPADKLGLTDEIWKSYSYSIRLEHECTHLYTLKKYGSATNNLHDELTADYIGISKTIGSYKKEWMLAFMGLEDYPNYRKGARLENYLGNTDLSFENFEQLTTIIKNAIENIAYFDAELGSINSDKDQMARMDALCEVSVLEIASEYGADLLLEKYERLY